LYWVELFAPLTAVTVRKPGNRRSISAIDRFSSSARRLLVDLVDPKGTGMVKSRSSLMRWNSICTLARQVPPLKTKPGQLAARYCSSTEQK